MYSGYLVVGIVILLSSKCVISGFLLIRIVDCLMDW